MPSRRQLLRATVGVLGGVAAASVPEIGAFAQGGRPGSVTPGAAALAQQLYGVSASDVQILPNAGRLQSLVDGRASNAKYDALVKRLQAEGLQPQESIAETIRVPFPNAPGGHLDLDAVRTILARGGQAVGAIHHITGSTGQVLLASVNSVAGTPEIHFEQSYAYAGAPAIEKAVFDRKAKLVASTRPIEPLTIPRSPLGISCTGVVGVLCAAGVVGSVGECAAACLATGFAWWLCEPLCVALIGLGCLVGANTICCICCNNC
jgi:hypothetical protein